jgi:hypothetical protein
VLAAEERLREAAAVMQVVESSSGEQVVPVAAVRNVPVQFEEEREYKADADGQLLLC